MSHSIHSTEREHRSPSLQSHRTPPDHQAKHGGFGSQLSEKTSFCPRAEPIRSRARFVSSTASLEQAGGEPQATAGLLHTLQLPARALLAEPSLSSFSSPHWAGGNISIQAEDPGAELPCTAPAVAGNGVPGQLSDDAGKPPDGCTSRLLTLRATLQSQAARDTRC